VIAKFQRRANYFGEMLLLDRGLQELHNHSVRRFRIAFGPHGYQLFGGARAAREQVLWTCESDERRELGRAAGQTTTATQGIFE